MSWIKVHIGCNFTAPRDPNDPASMTQGYAEKEAFLPHLPRTGDILGLSQDHTYGTVEHISIFEDGTIQIDLDEDISDFEGIIPPYSFESICEFWREDGFTVYDMAKEMKDPRRRPGIGENN